MPSGTQVPASALPLDPRLVPTKALSCPGTTAPASPAQGPAQGAGVLGSGAPASAEALEFCLQRGPEAPAPIDIPILRDSSTRKGLPVLPSGSQLLPSPSSLQGTAPPSLYRELVASGGRALRTSLEEMLNSLHHPPRPRLQPVDAGAQPRSRTHSPVEFVVVIVDLPPEVEPGEREAEGEGEEQEPEALPLQGQSEGSGQAGQGWSLRRLHPEGPPRCSPAARQGYCPPHGRT